MINQSINQSIKQASKQTNKQASNIKHQASIIIHHHHYSHGHRHQHVHHGLHHLHHERKRVICWLKLSNGGSWKRQNQNCCMRVHFKAFSKSLAPNNKTIPHVGRDLMGDGIYELWKELCSLALRVYSKRYSSSLAPWLHQFPWPMRSNCLCFYMCGSTSFDIPHGEFAGTRWTNHSTTQRSQTFK